MKGRILIVGATSAIGRALAVRLAGRGVPLLLAARDAEELARTAADIEVRFGTRPVTGVFDAEKVDGYRELFAAWAPDPEALDGLVLCHGDTGDIVSAHGDPVEARRLIDVNFSSCAGLLSLAAPYFEARRRGVVCAVGSVAGDRGRASNYLYGACKGALEIYLQGLRQRLAKAGVAVLLVKPGFVDSAMTFGRPGLFLVASPDRVARDILRAMRRRRTAIYTPWFWRWIMLIIRTIPEPVFKRLSF